MLLLLLAFSEVFCGDVSRVWYRIVLMRGAALCWMITCGTVNSPLLSGAYLAYPFYDSFICDVSQLSHQLIGHSTPLSGASDGGANGMDWGIVFPLRTHGPGSVK